MALTPLFYAALERSETVGEGKNQAKGMNSSHRDLPGLELGLQFHFLATRSPLPPVVHVD